MTAHDQYTQRGGQEPYDQQPFDQERLDQQPYDQQPFDQQPLDQERLDQQHYDQQPFNQDQYGQQQSATSPVPPPPTTPPPTQERLAAPEQGELIDPVQADTSAATYDHQRTGAYDAERDEFSDPVATDSAVARTPGPDAGATREIHEDSADSALFADDDLSGLRTDWDRVQATFVDDPQQCVREADALVADVVDKLTTSIGTTRSKLEAQWAGGEEVSTEDLRVALTQYREFFKRLLTV